MSKKKKVTLVVALIVFLIALVLGFTYSKYTSSVPVVGQAATAAWHFDGAISNTGSQTKTISLADTISEDSIESGRIAPGTSGTFKIIIDANGSEVDVDYDVLLKSESSTKPTNLYFTCEDLVNSKKDGELIKYYSLDKLLEVDKTTQRSNMSGTIDKDENGTPKEIVVTWTWPYESPARDEFSADDLDEKDTDDSGITDYSFTLNIVGKQAN